MKCKTYNVIPGEPQLGKVRECTVTIDRDAVVSAITDALESDLYLSPKYEIEVEGFEFPIDEFLDRQDLYQLQDEIERNFLDDEFGDQKFLDYLYNAVDKLVPNGPFEYDYQEYI